MEIQTALKEMIERADRSAANDVLLGGLDGPTLAKMSVEEVEKRCREILEDRRDDRRYVLTTSGPDVALDTPQENIHAIRRAAESFGKGESHD